MDTAKARLPSLVRQLGNRTDDSVRSRAQARFRYSCPPFKLCSVQGKHAGGLDFTSSVCMCESSFQMLENLLQKHTKCENVASLIDLLVELLFSNSTSTLKTDKFWLIFTYALYDLPARKLPRSNCRTFSEVCILKSLCREIFPEDVWMHRVADKCLPHLFI